MKDQILLAILADTNREVRVPPTPARDWAGSGWDWIDACDDSDNWDVAGTWNDRDLGEWPYVIYALASVGEGAEAVHGYAVYVEGDIRAHWFANRDARNQAITVEAALDRALRG